MSVWQAQFNRMLRSLERAEKFDADAVEQGDHLASFFQNCWHLKDWVANDDTLPRGTRDAITQDAETIESLKYCADLANKFKHYKLTKGNRRGAVLWYVRSARTIDAKTGEILSEVPLGYSIGGRQGYPVPSDAIGFARRAVQDWRVLLAKHGLTPVI